MNEKKLINPNAPADFTPSQNSYETTDRVSPFRMFCYENFPYIEQDFDSVTTYQLLQKVVEYLNKVIKNLNVTENNLGKMGENVTHLYNAYVQLQDYVNNYFTNLDVQTEINNKLDEMVADGTLDNILMNYANITKVYNTIADLKSDSINMVNNMNCKTLGYYSINDGGSATYKITNVKSETEYQEDLGNGLYATIVTYKINLLQMGSKENNDISDILQIALNNYDYVEIPKGNFIISKPINTGKCLNLNGNSNGNTYLKYTNLEDTCLTINTGYTKVSNISIIGTEDLPSNATGININQKLYTELENISVMFLKNGINIGKNSWNTYYKNVYIYKCETGWIIQDEVNAIILENCYAKKCKTGFYKQAGATVTLLDCDIESCDIGFRIENKGDLNIINSYFELNKINVDIRYGLSPVNIVNIENCSFATRDNTDIIIKYHGDENTIVNVNGCFFRGISTNAKIFEKGSPGTKVIVNFSNSYIQPGVYIVGDAKYLDLNKTLRNKFIFKETEIIETTVNNTTVSVDYTEPTTPKGYYLFNKTIRRADQNDYRVSITAPANKNFAVVSSPFNVNVKFKVQCQYIYADNYEFQ